MSFLSVLQEKKKINGRHSKDEITQPKSSFLEINFSFVSLFSKDSLLHITSHGILNVVRINKVLPQRIVEKTNWNNVGAPSRVLNVKNWNVFS